MLNIHLVLDKAIITQYTYEATKISNFLSDIYRTLLFLQLKQQILKYEAFSQ